MFSVPPQALKEDFHRSAAFKAGELGFDVGEHANLRRHSGAAAQLVEVVQNAGDIVHGVDGRVDADEGVAGRQRQPPIDEKSDAAQVVGGMIGLQSRGERARAAQKRAGPAWAG